MDRDRSLGPSYGDIHISVSKFSFFNSSIMVAVQPAFCFLCEHDSATRTSVFKEPKLCHGTILLAMNAWMSAVHRRVWALRVGYTEVSHISRVCELSGIRRSKMKYPRVYAFWQLILRGSGTLGTYNILTVRETKLSNEAFSVCLGRVSFNGL